MGATISGELFAKAPARIGLLADVGEALGAAGVNIVAIGAYDKEHMGEFYLLTSDNERSAEALEGLGFEIEENTVLVVDLADSPGQLGGIARLLADGGINVEWVYATTTGVGHEMVVFRTSDNERAAAIINEG